ncbi:MAG: hypothetical protein ABFD54_12505 [Armatimonadota bacterium]|nr:hypothetical protein [bacterium]
MSISIQGNTSSTYLAMKANSVQSQVSLSGDPESVEAALSAKQSSGGGNINGKLNSLEHSSTTNARPMFIRNTLRQLTGVKVRDIDIEQMNLSRSSVSLDSAQISVEQDAASQTVSAEQMHVEGQKTSLAVQGTVQTKSGDDLSFDLQLSSTKLSAAYAAYSCETNTTDQLDVAA